MQATENNEFDDVVPERFFPGSIIITKKAKKQNSAYLAQVADVLALSDVATFMKQNYKCKAGTVDDSNKCDPNNNTASENTKFEGIKKYLQPVDDVVAKTMHDNELSFYSTLKQSEKNVIDHWASKQKQANNYLFTGIGPGKQTVKIIDDMIKNSIVPIDITSYSGIPGHRVKQLVGEFDVGDEFKFNGFMSTSLDFSFSSIFGASEGGCILKIETPKGTNGIYIEKNKENKITEHEVVLDRGQSWIVNEVEKYDGITIVSIKRK